MRVVAVSAIVFRTSKPSLASELRWADTAIVGQMGTQSTSFLTTGAL
jgi:hypothetical protein